MPHATCYYKRLLHRRRIWRSAKGREGKKGDGAENGKEMFAESALVRLIGSLAASREVR